MLVFVTSRVGMSKRGSQRTRNGGDSLEMGQRYLVTLPLLPRFMRLKDFRGILRNRAGAS